MSGAYKARQGWIVALSVLMWVATAYAAVKPRDPNSTAPSPQKATARQPQKAAASAVALQSPATFTPDMPFGRAIEILRQSTRPAVNIVVLWRDVEGNAGITRDTPIGLDGVPGLRVRQYLELLLRSVSAGSSAELGYVIDGGVVIVATKSSLPKPKMETRIYDISDLAAPPSMGMPMFMPMPMMSPFGVGSPMQPFGNYGTGMPYNGYGSGAGYNNNPAGNLPGFVNSTQRTSPSRGVVLGGS